MQTITKPTTDTQILALPIFPKGLCTIDVRGEVRGTACAISVSTTLEQTEGFISVSQSCRSFTVLLSRGVETVMIWYLHICVLTSRLDRWVYQAPNVCLTSQTTWSWWRAAWRRASGWWSSSPQSPSLMWPTGAPPCPKLKQWQSLTGR